VWESGYGRFTAPADLMARDQASALPAKDPGRRNVDSIGAAARAFSTSRCNLASRSCFGVGVEHRCGRQEHDVLDGLLDEGVDVGRCLVEKDRGDPVE
jgi:hypothetical protein